MLTVSRRLDAWGAATLSNLAAPRANAIIAFALFFRPREECCQACGRATEHDFEFHAASDGELVFYHDSMFHLILYMRMFSRHSMQELLSNNPDFMQPAARRNEVLGWVKSGLRDFSISRSASAMSWGIPLPQDASHNTYVWCAHASAKPCKIPAGWPSRRSVGLP